MTKNHRPAGEEKMKNKLTKEKKFHNSIKRAFKKFGFIVDEINFKREILRTTYPINFPETRDIIVGESIILECYNIKRVPKPAPRERKQNRKKS